MCVEILVARRHFSFRCGSYIEYLHFLCRLVCASSLLISSSAPLVSSSVSLSREALLSWSRPTPVLFPFSDPMNSPVLLLSSSVTPSSLFVSFFARLYFLLVCWISRSILRWVDRTIFSCSAERVHLPAPYVLFMR